MTIVFDKEFFLDKSRLNAFCLELSKGKSIEDSFESSEESREGFFKATDYIGNKLGDFNTRKEAEGWLKEKFDEECVDDELGVNETRTDTAYVIEEDEDGNEIARHKVDLSYTNERSDYDEHNTMYTGGCI